MLYVDEDLPPAPYGGLGWAPSKRTSVRLHFDFDCYDTCRTIILFYFSHPHPSTLHCESTAAVHAVVYSTPFETHACMVVT